MPHGRDLLPLLRDIRGRLGESPSLEGLARRSGWSRFHLHRAFRKIVGETPKQYVLRLRLERAAGDLIATRSSVAFIARASGFASHEVFTRAFRKCFGTSPRQYRLTALPAASPSGRARQRRLIESAGPCIRLLRLQTHPPTEKKPMPLLTIERKEIAPMPFLFVRRQAARSEISQTLAECFGIVFPHCMQAGLEMAGFPLARYSGFGPGLVTIEAGIPLAQPTTPVGEMQYTELPGGPVVLAVHAGSYDELGGTHAAIERWIQERGLRTTGAHWEWYVTDPGEHPDPKDWRTHIYYPVAQ